MQRHIVRRTLTAAASLLVLAPAIALTPRLAAAQSTSIPSTATYACDFENSYCDFNEQSAVGDAPPSSARRSSIIAPGRAGSYAVRLHTEPGDNSVHGSGTWERDDLEKSPDGSYCNNGQDEWWAISVMFPSDFVYPPSGSTGGAGIFDFHHNADNGLPNFSIEMMPDTGMRIRGYGGSQVNGGQYNAQIADPYGAVSNVTRNVWYDFVVHIKWSSNSDGISETWLNGKKVQSYSGATLYSGISCYLKLANYHAPYGQPTSTIYDRVVRGTGPDVALTPLEGVNGAAAPVQVATNTTGSTTTSTPSTTSTSSGAKAAVSSTMDSSNYVSAAGQGVTFTARVMGNSATPTGNVTFNSDGNPISGCSAVGVSGGAATCTTSALGGGSHAITGIYSGDSTYGPAQAGPITQTVSGTASASTSSSSGSTSGSSGSTSGGSTGVTSGGISAPWYSGSIGNGSVSATMDSSAYVSSTGQGVTFTAAMSGGSGTAGGTVSFRDGGNAIPGCGSIAVSGGKALCTTAALSAGTHSITGVYSGDASYGPAQAGPITQTVSGSAQSLTTAGSSMNVQGIWWGGASESGWGLNLAQQGNIVFATWFTYDAQGNAQWLVMPNAAGNGNTYSGTLYRATGPAFSAAAFDPSQVASQAVGTMTLTFSDANNGTMTATVDGSTVTKTITRDVYDTRMPMCAEGMGPSSTPNMQDMWWRASGTESGWGVNLAHEGNTIFLTWFTYDQNGRGMWLVASNVAKNTDGTYSGTLYRTTGPAFNTPQWNASQVSSTPVGAVSLSFSDASNGMFNYTVNGVSGSKPISRLQYAMPATMCQSSM